MGAKDLDAYEAKPDGTIPYDADAHYELVREWWAHYYDGDPFPKACLPDTGSMVLHKGKPAGVAFIYQPNAKMAHIHFAMVDPSIGAGRRIKILREAVASAIEMAKEFLQGEGFIWCCTDNAVVARVYSENNMVCSGEADVFYLQVGKQNEEFLK